MTPTQTAEDVAKWMLAQIQERSYLDQGAAARQIRELFGDGFLYKNANGNPAISKAVLKLFQKLSGDDVVWDRSDRSWRKRAAYHKPGRQQD